MKKYSILFLMGEDRPGIVDHVSTFLFDKGANIEDSRMAVMGGCFSIMMLFSCSVEELEKVNSGLSELRWVLKHPSTMHRRRKRLLIPENLLKLSVTSMDHPGIVKEVVRILRRHDVNIRAMNTETKSAPLSGAPIFSMMLEGVLPGGRPLSMVRKDLTTLAFEMNMDLDFLPVDTGRQ